MAEEKKEEGRTARRRTVQNRNVGNGNGYVGPMTDRTFGGRLKAAKLQPKIFENEAGLIELTTYRPDVAPLIEFDRLYKPYVLFVLRRDYGFRCWSVPVTGDSDELDEPTETVAPAADDDSHATDGSQEAEDVYRDVLIRLLEGALWRFDFGKENVGHGAFRNYLKQVIQSVVMDTRRKELIPVLDDEGNPVYEKKLNKDGTPKLDKDGRPIVKMKMMRATEFNEEVANAALERGATHLFAAPRPNDRLLAKLVWDLSVVAYLRLVMSRPETHWMKVLRAVFENQWRADEVVQRLQAEGLIRDRNAYYVAKSRFRDAWEKQRYLLIDQICETTIGGKVVKVTKDARGRSQVLIPASQSQNVLRRLRVSADEARAFVKAKQVACERKYGSEEVRRVTRAFTEAMLALETKADEEAAAKNAKFYKE